MDVFLLLCAGRLMNEVFLFLGDAICCLAVLWKEKRWRDSKVGIWRSWRCYYNLIVMGLVLYSTSDLLSKWSKTSIQQATNLLFTEVLYAPFLKATISCPTPKSRPCWKDLRRLTHAPSLFNDLKKSKYSFPSIPSVYWCSHAGLPVVLIKIWRKLTSPVLTEAYIYQSNHAEDEKLNSKGSRERMGNECMEDKKGRTCWYSP